MHSTFQKPDLSSALVLTGPTASGKSALAMAIARQCGAEIIALDSMTLYRGMDIGTAKPSAADRAAVRHHLIDILDPWEEASVAWWLEQALAAAQAIQSRARRVLFVGGTGLYLKALLCGLFEGPGAFDQIRIRLEREAQQPGGKDQLYKQLQDVDPQLAHRLHANDVRRVIRGLEVWEATGRRLSSWQGQWQQEGASARSRPAVFWIDLPRALLHERINGRVIAMLRSGWLEEAKSLRNLEQPLSLTAMQALGYRELFQHLDGAISLDEARERIQAGTRQFAKRQVTWFRHLPGCQPVTTELRWEPWGLELGIE